VQQRLAKIARKLGRQKTIRLPNGLARNYDMVSMRGQADILATVAAPGMIRLHDQQIPDHRTMQAVRAPLAPRTDARGRRLPVMNIPATRTLRDAQGLFAHDGRVHCIIRQQPARRTP
jgi:agmatine deiminase